MTPPLPSAALVVALFLTCASVPSVRAGAPAAEPGTAAESDAPHSDRSAETPRASERLVGRTAYAGLALRQNPEGVVVVGVQPGPFGGDGVRSPSIWRGDLIVSMNGQSLDVGGYIGWLRTLAPGDALRVVYRRAVQADPLAAVPRGDRGGEERSVEVVLDDAAKWRGTLGRGLGARKALAPAQAGEFEALLLAKAERLGLREPPAALDAQLAYLATLQRALLDPNSVPAVVHALERPLSLDRTEADFAAQVRPLAPPQTLSATLAALHRLVLGVLDLKDLQAQPDVASRLSTARREYAQAAADLLTGMRDGSATASADFARTLELMRASPQLVPLSVAMLPYVVQRVADLEQFAQEALVSPAPLAPELADRVQAAVEGTVLGARLVDGELWIVGGGGENRYRMELISAVFDTGGADTYTYAAPAPGPYQLIVDASGDDLYESGADMAGPAAALFGVSILNDRSGNDRYVSHAQAGIAAGVFGVALLLDEAGDDQYVNDTPAAGWSQGAGLYGAGVLVDRAGADRYQAQVLAQGAGGPGGMGLLVDAAGNDTYTANGPHFASVYDTPGVFVGWSQGFGLGLRGYAAGGIGALYDLAGDDAYSVGEYGQGSGYFQALGILHDAAGNDRYVGSRYAQGSAAHQAAGILVDEAGADTYLCPGPAAQGAAWDLSVAMLIDRAGDDSYSAAGLAQGSAAQLAVAMRLDLGGDDVYACPGTCLGHSEDNAYHYDATGLFNFSASIDRGAGIDRYPGALSNDLLSRTGAQAQGRPAAWECCGVFLDE